MLRQVAQLPQHGGTVLPGLSHTQDTAAADIDALSPHLLDGIQTVLVGAGGNHIAVELGRSVQVVVVVVKTSISQTLGLLCGKHA